MFKFRSRLKLLVRFACYAIVSSVLVAVILSAKHRSTNYISSQSQRTVTYSDWNFYEDVGENNEEIKEIANENINCDTIHVATVCGGYNSTREFYVLLKSILFYRTNPIHLHLLVDDIAYKILTKLFQTWQVPNLMKTYYNASIYEHQVSWIPTHHYSNQFGLLKLVFPSIILDQSNVTKVIMLDTDMLMLGNINELFKELKRMNSSNNRGPSISLVENQSDWYLGKQILSVPIQDRLIWPAVGRGFNTGLLLLDLLKLNESKWDQLWRDTAEMELITRFSTALADQDIFNAVLKLYPHLYHILPCRFNIQLNEHAELNKTCRNHLQLNEFKLIHWNSPHKLETNNPFVNDYLSWYSTFVNWDASLLKRNIPSCAVENIKTEENKTDSQINLLIEESCKGIKPRPSDTLRTYLFFMEFGHTSNETGDVSIVVHLSVDRLRVLDELAAHWQGPISAAVYLSETETSLFIDSLNYAKYLSRRKNIGYHLVFRDFGCNYPINRLRNIALNQATTEFVLLADVDFLSSYNLYDYLKATISNWPKSDSLATSALVVPAFESSQYKLEFPSSKSELVMLVNLGTVSMFRGQIWPRGHAPTDYTRWKMSTRAYQVDWRPDYEPFVVVSKQVARFDERFVGFGWNKVEHIMQLAAMDYRFWVLPDAFLIHQFHPASYDIVRHRESQKYRACIRQLKKVFTSELVNKYAEFFDKLKNASDAVHGSTLALSK